MEKILEKYNVKSTEWLHQSKISLGYFYYFNGNKFVACIGSIEIQEYDTKEACVHSFQNRQ